MVIDIILKKIYVYKIDLGIEILKRFVMSGQRKLEKEILLVFIREGRGELGEFSILEFKKKKIFRQDEIFKSV